MKLSIKLIALSAFLLTLVVFHSCKKEEKLDTYIIETTSRYEYYRQQEQSKKSSSLNKQSNNVISYYDPSAPELCSGHLDYSFVLHAYGVDNYTIDYFKSSFRNQLESEFNQYYPGLFMVSSNGIVYQSAGSDVVSTVEQVIINAVELVKSDPTFSGIFLEETSIQVTEFGKSCQNNPNIPTNPIPNPGTSTPPIGLDKDPCAQKAKISALVANPILASQITQLRQKNQLPDAKEWGFKQNVSSVGGSNYVTTNIETSANNELVNLGMDWGSVSGHTIGWIHNHPSNNPPSYQDIFSIYESYLNSGISNATQIQFYKDNVSISVVTNTETFVITIKDWNALVGIYNTYNSNRFNFQTEFSELTSGWQSPQYGSISEYDAILIYDAYRFNNAINIFRATAGSTDFKPIEVGLDANNNPATRNKPCN